MLKYHNVQDIMHKNLRIPHDIIFIADATFSVPTERWVTRNFKKYFKKVMNVHHTYVWTKAHDCDNFATAYRMYMQFLHSEQSNHDSESIAVCEMHYKIDNAGYHAINAVIVDNYRVIFIEPQTGNKVNLSNQEKRSCYFVRF
jgi:hypothetical protein